MRRVRVAIVIAAVAACSKKPDDRPPADPPVKHEVPPPAPDAAVDAAPPNVVEEVALGFDTVCARLTDGTTYCWGKNQYGALGIGQGDELPGKGPVPGISGAVSIASGPHFTCVATASGSVSCWGQNDFGQLGSRTEGTCSSESTMGTSVSACSRVPIDVGVEGAIAVTAGQQHACALTKAGTVWCWGRGDQVKDKPEECVLNSGMKVGCVPKATEIKGAVDVVEIAAADIATCARTKAGTVMCWGGGLYGELGNGKTTGEPWTTKPGAVVGLTDVVQLAAYGTGFCARRKAGDVMCWGEDDRGKLGDGKPPLKRKGTIHGQPSPQAVPGLANVTDLWAHAETTCAAQPDGNYCWGRVEHTVAVQGQIDACPASTKQSDVCPIAPPLRATDKTVRRLYDTGMKSCALGVDGSLRCDTVTLR